MGSFNTQPDVAAIIADLQSRVRQLETSAAQHPAGVIYPFAGTTVPAGTLLCDGSPFNVLDEPALFAAIGYVWGGFSPTFRVPDLRGRTLVGAGTGLGLSARTLGQQLGVEAVRLLSAESGLPSHGHTFSGNNINVPTSAIGESAGMYHRWNAGDLARGDNTVSNGYYVLGVGGSVGASAADAVNAHTNVQPSAGVNYIITT